MISYNNKSCLPFFSRNRRDNLNLSDGFVPLSLRHELALIVVGVVADPVQRYGGRQHCVCDGEAVAQRKGLRTERSAQLSGISAHAPNIRGRE